MRSQATSLARRTAPVRASWAASCAIRARSNVSVRVAESEVATRRPHIARASAKPNGPATGWVNAWKKCRIIADASPVDPEPDPESANASDEGKLRHNEGGGMTPAKNDLHTHVALLA